MTPRVKEIGQRPAKLDQREACFRGHGGRLRVEGEEEPVEASTVFHSRLPGSICLRWAVASGMGTWVNSLRRNPITTLAHPFIAACTAL